MKIWIKTFKNEKIRLNHLVNDAAPLTVDNLCAVLTEVCDKYDLPTPVITANNVENLQNFNHTKLKQADFLEKINFDFMEITKILK